MTIYQPRSEAVRAEYEAFAANNPSDYFEFADEEVVHEYEHWVIIKNRFPYDNIAAINHLLVSREPIELLIQAPEAVRTEYENIVHNLAHLERYDAIIQNLPGATTVRAQYHVHLIKWHGTNAQDGN